MNNLTLSAVPFSQEAEQAVLGAVLLNTEAYLSIASFLRADDFFIARNREIWMAIQRVSERGDPIDFVTVQEQLRAAGVLNDVGGLGYLMQLATDAPTSVNAEVYGRLVERAAVRRRLMEAADQIKQLAIDETLETEDVTTRAEKTIFAVTERNLRRDIIPLRDAASDFYERMELRMQNPDAPMGVPTGFFGLDEMMGGFQNSDLLIFAGRPGVGKTSFLLTVAMNSAKFGARVAIFSMEMGAEQIVQRLVAMETGIDLHRLRSGHLNDDEWGVFVTAIGKLSEMRVFIDDTPALTPLQMRAKCRRLQHEYGLELVILDYIQLMSAGGAFENNRVQEISYISRNMKEMARELNVPVLAAAQLSRAVEQRQDKHPQLSDLRESGCVSGDSDVFLPDCGYAVPIRDLVGKIGVNVLTLNLDTYKLESAPITNAFCTGIKPVYKLTTRLGRTIRATANHKFYTIDGWKRLDELTTDDHIAVSDTETKITWDSVASINSDGETDVYDLTVPPYANFVIENLVVHNSIEQDADLVMFLYRDIVYNPSADPKIAEIIVAKHRNGPTGKVDLFFDRRLTKFHDADRRTVDLGGI